jgi:hypothetical protein
MKCGAHCTILNEIIAFNIHSEKNDVFSMFVEVEK